MMLIRSVLERFKLQNILRSANYNNTIPYHFFFKFLSESRVSQVKDPVVLRLTIFLQGLEE